MSASYLRADTTAICDCIQAFGLNDLLFSIARLERLFKQRSCNGTLSLKSAYRSRHVPVTASQSRPANLGDCTGCGRHR